MGEMTNEQAVRWLKDLLKSDLPMEQYETAIEKGIEALKPSGDLISREETLTAFADYVGSGMSMNDYDALWDIVAKMPSVKQEPCDDAISRQAVQDYLAKYLSQYLYNDVREAVEVIDEYIGELPSVNPTKTGHWIWCVGSHKCSNCEEYTWFSHRELLRYCPNCGAKMESEV